MVLNFVGFMSNINVILTLERCEGKEEEICVYEIPRVILTLTTGAYPITKSGFHEHIYLFTSIYMGNSANSLRTFLDDLTYPSVKYYE
mmetsp:Transcript_31032/g.36879  ORF Transcript_31032/g.36879 Transcript_31032/m.36879 type:complete len:88 (-) Transcript_31032:49-312(-)